MARGNETGMIKTQNTYRVTYGLVFKTGWFTKQRHMFSADIQAPSRHQIEVAAQLAAEMTIRQLNLPAKIECLHIEEL